MPTDAGLSSLICLDGIQFSWPGQVPVIDTALLEIAPGEHCFIQGPSGSGKSTLLNLVAGVLMPQSGAIRVLEQDLCTLGTARRDRFRADHIGYIFQQFNLIPYLSIIENVMLPCRFSPLRRERARQRSGSVKDEARYLLSHLYEASNIELERSVTRLSVGQQQRVAAARALMGQPELLIADEPTSSLDIDNRHAFMDLLFSEAQQAGTTLLFVSHDPAFKNRFDRHIDMLSLAPGKRSAA